MVNQIKMGLTEAIYRLLDQDKSYRAIGRILGLHRKTVARYARDRVASVPAVGGAGEGQTSASAGQAAVSVAGAKWPKVTAGMSASRSKCTAHHEYIEAKLAQGLTAQRVYQDLVLERGFTDSYESVKRYVRKLGTITELPFRRMECAPGQEVQVDFCKGSWLMLPDGKRRRYWVWRMVLSYSRAGYSEAVWRQDLETVIRVLENGLRYFGGSPLTTVPDNMKTAVVEADWFDPELNPKLAAFAQHYQTVLLPTRPATPRHKGKVENNVAYVQDNALRGHPFQSLAQVNAHLSWWERNVADQRIHGTTRRQVRLMFAEEQPRLQPLPPDLFPFFHEARRSVHRDGYVEVARAYYSVPYEYVRRQVWARWDSREVRLFNDQMAQIAYHARREPGQFSTLQAHIAPQKISGADRGVGWYLSRCELLGAGCHRWAHNLVLARGFTAIRVLQGLLALTKNYPASAIDTVCQQAIQLDSYQLKTLRQLLQSRGGSGTAPQAELWEQHELIRPLADYAAVARARGVWWPPAPAGTTTQGIKP